MITPEEKDYICEVLREDDHNRMLKFERASFCPVIRSQPLSYAKTGLNIDPRTTKPEGSAERTLRNLGYTDNGGELWKPPIGEKPNFSLIDALRQQLADVSHERDGLRSASQWVSIKDRMPEIEQQCLIRIPVLQYFEIEGAKYLGDGQWVGAFCSARGKGKCYKVTHWMPLPNPPTEQDAQQ